MFVLGSIISLHRCVFSSLSFFPFFFYRTEEMSVVNEREMLLSKKVPHGGKANGEVKGKEDTGSEGGGNNGIGGDDDALVDSFEYEVFGKVQKVGFRVFMNKAMHEINHGEQARSRLGCNGNNNVGGRYSLLSAKAENTKTGTVKGVVYGGEENLMKMKHWLEHVGSPRSVIDRCEFKNEQKNVKRLIVGFTSNRFWPLWLSPDFCPGLCTFVCVPIAKTICGEGTRGWRLAKYVANCLKGKKHE